MCIVNKVINFANVLFAYCRNRIKCMAIKARCKKTKWTDSARESRFWHAHVNIIDFGLTNGWLWFLWLVRCFVVVRLVDASHQLTHYTLFRLSSKNAKWRWQRPSVCARADFACHLIPGRRYDLCTSFVWHLTYTLTEHWRRLCHSLCHLSHVQCIFSS